MDYIDEKKIENSLKYDSLIPAIQEGFNAHIKVPMRHHHDYYNPVENNDSTLLIMPAWNPGDSLGIKCVTVSPNNSKYELPAINGIYILYDAVKGVPRALLDAKSLTRIRTAATSALASTFLSRKDAKTLLVIGTGALAPELIKAHCTVRNFEEVYIWGRNPEKASKVAKALESEFDINVATDLNECVAQSDVISCATLSETPLIEGKYLKSGSHVDLVGAYRKDMREADDDVISRSRLFVDSIETAPKETGDLVIPIQKGLIDLSDIKADLFELCAGRKPGRSTDEEITCFKSVGHALEDLVAAQMVLKELNR